MVENDKDLSRRIMDSVETGALGQSETLTGEFGKEANAAGLKELLGAIPVGFVLDVSPEEMTRAIVELLGQREQLRGDLEQTSSFVKGLQNQLQMEQRTILERDRMIGRGENHFGVPPSQDTFAGGMT